MESDAAAALHDLPELQRVPGRGCYCAGEGKLNAKLNKKGCGSSAEAPVSGGWVIKGGFLEEELLEMDLDRQTQDQQVAEGVRGVVLELCREWGEESTFRNPKRQGGAGSKVGYMAVHCHEEILVQIFFSGWKTSSRCLRLLLESSSNKHRPPC